MRLYVNTAPFLVRGLSIHARGSVCVCVCVSVCVCPGTKVPCIAGDECI